MLAWAQDKPAPRAAALGKGGLPVSWHALRLLPGKRSGCGGFTPNCSAPPLSPTDKRSYKVFGLDSGRVAGLI